MTATGTKILAHHLTAVRQASESHESSRRKNPARVAAHATTNASVERYCSAIRTGPSNGTAAAAVASPTANAPNANLVA